MLAGRFAAAVEHPSLILVGSTNRVKIAAVDSAVRSAFPKLLNLEVRGVASSSGVPDQPVGDDETLLGALNRVDDMQRQHATLAGCAGPAGDASAGLKGQDQDVRSPWLLVAVEGGVLWRRCKQRQTRQLYCMAWAVAKSPLSGAVSQARSAEFLLPPALAELVEDGMELGHADDKVFGRKRSGQGTGTIGKLTNGLITREQYYTHAVQMALVPFLNPDLYPDIVGERI